MPAWGMAYRNPIRKWIKTIDRLIVVEDHLLDAGFTSWVLESLVGTPDIIKVRTSCLTDSSIGFVASESLIHHQVGLYELDTLFS